MSASIMLLATLGGSISFLSTSFGALLSLRSWKTLPFTKFKFSVDFALGVMLSVVAFSLVGPTTLSSLSRPNLLLTYMSGFMLGGLLIYAIKAFVERKQVDQDRTHPSSSQLLLALALIIHNFPEGLASGASLAGFSFQSAAPILGPIALQNIPEGLLMVLCLKSMGWSQEKAFLGGIASGVVELIGGVLAGFAMGWTSEALPVILMMAGGAMFVSVVIEISEKGNVLRQLLKPEFAVGLLLIPVLNTLVG